ncbi:hypothetical protein HMI54_012704 [Coelomomyces lativittatus]|nr:hypothetical protein HMI56_002543 [Coelomomyces lativittatus]KAJ1515209.1 hypothetical protein HMI54_012704 [Coelomomyces lativittatus]KAJ1517915.1 hypothetical protein HMI55_004911 [Coelomomyces lativittatus]
MSYETILEHAELYTDSYLELGLALLYSIFLCLLAASFVAVQMGTLNKTPTGRMLLLLYANYLVYCITQKILNGYSLMVTLESYDVPQVLIVKFIECYSKNSSALYNLLASVMYIDLSRSTSFFPIRKYVTEASYFRRIFIIVQLLCISSSIVAVTTYNQVLIRRSQLFLYNSNAQLLGVVIFSFGWTALFAFAVLVIKWTDYFMHKPLSVLAPEKEERFSAIFVLKLAGFMGTLQQVICMVITIVPFVGIDQSVEPWITILNLSSIIALPFDSILPFFAQKQRMRKRSNQSGSILSVKDRTRVEQVNLNNLERKGLRTPSLLRNAL